MSVRLMEFIGRIYANTNNSDILSTELSLISTDNIIYGPCNEERFSKILQILNKNL